ncbi:FAD-binding oxidoreductase [Phyllobacterium sp. P30BS-XVII]|uniref:NAD(P)/FAD-dependent oxidoreductase n=1 Tax=Phyllobacterium sp. P30BS-XVII TaxID=2587046 RepID=UPI0015FB4EDA|nr:FAD-binding oxidoreductase [Phyllobacterium sp. P30BS-XVII]MBA8901767.1 D-arginine dehydrogenase [Phyllobacterium sp. P30BS-XVII]
MTDIIDTDVLIIGAGIAGVGAAAELSSTHKVIILERESQPAYHSTGRSAAIFLPNYGNDVIRALNRASAPMFMQRDTKLFPEPLLTLRGSLTVADDTGIEHCEDLLKNGVNVEEISADRAVEMVPILNRDYIKAACYQAEAQDIDVNALHQGWLRKATGLGVDLRTNAEVIRARRSSGFWLVETADQTFRAQTVINAAGAWADVIAGIFGGKPLGLTPLRRSIAVLPAPEGYDTRGWPLVDDANEAWYLKPDGGRLFVSPCDETPVEPHDAYVDDMILAEGLYRYEQAVTVPVNRVERSWAGLRTFAPDRTPVAGFDAELDGFFWLAGQGGYGIQTAPALSQFTAMLIRQESLPDALAQIAPRLSAARFQPSNG